MVRDDEGRRLAAEHTPEAIRDRLNRAPTASYLRNFIFGAVDGTVTTFAVVSGATGALLPGGVVVVLGAANLLADGFSMAVSIHLGTRGEIEERDRARHEEERQVALVPEGEREEIRQIFAAKGFEGDVLDRVVEVITSDTRRWVETMLSEELGYPRVSPSPARAGLMTFLAFVVAGAVPLAPFLLDLLKDGGSARPFFWSAVLTAGVFFGIGSLKSLFVEQRWYRAGVETLALGGGAACLAYLVGALLRGVVAS
jgi:vacuolar iron transporter family protein